MESAASFLPCVVDSSIERKLEPNTRAAVRSAGFRMICSDDEGALSSRKVQDFFKAEGTALVDSKTYAKQAEGAIRTVKKMFADRLRANKDKTKLGLK